ncbi:hypothetical protein BmHoA_00142 [Borrelia miyamotoi]|nr:efflux RND transporter permease subunit [Borrelia miyamotoi]BCR19093.1 hypothetical protein BmHoA_00142 [Borrelia miyamotoi]BCR19926.1 hypothetical protein BmHoB_00143 [Borrelia miyamotoi]
MSALTSIIGFFPLAFSDSSDNALIRPIAFTFIGGMIASTLLTLLFIPVIFEIFSKLSVKNFIFFKSCIFIGRINPKEGGESFFNKSQSENSINISKNNDNGNTKIDGNFDNLFIDED